MHIYVHAFADFDEFLYANSGISSLKVFHYTCFLAVYACCQGGWAEDSQTPVLTKASLWLPGSRTLIHDYNLVMRVVKSLLGLNLGKGTYQVIQRECASEG